MEEDDSFPHDVTVFPPTVQQAGDPRRGDATWTLMPPSPDVCSQCAVDHNPDYPHYQPSLYYQFAFYSEHTRWPTWKDAMAHCDTEVREATREVLQRHGIEPPMEAEEAG